MELALFIYLAGVVEGIKDTFVWISIIGAIVVFSVIFAFYLDGAFTMQKFYKPIAIVISCAVFASLVPTERTMYMMAGGYFGQQMLQSETASKVVTVVNSKLDDYIKEMDAK